jgi:hypothetical protein
MALFGGREYPLTQSTVPLPVRRKKTRSRALAFVVRADRDIFNFFPFSRQKGMEKRKKLLAKRSMRDALFKDAKSEIGNLKIC